jgi:uncharacterized protein YndB with AHSA1/START domain
MKWMIIAAVVLVLAIVALLIVAALKPDTFSVSRSRKISAPASKLFALVNDFQGWPQWAPQDREDPSMVRTFSGPYNGAGALSGWTSRGSAGKGRMEITRSCPDSEIEVRVEFLKPFAAQNVNLFQFSAEQDATLVTWSLRGTNVFALKLMSVFTNTERLVGLHLEAGLLNLDHVLVPFAN